MNRFRNDLKKLTAEEIFKRHIIHPNSATLTDDQYFNLKDVIAKHFKIDFSDVVMVGSAKLGFSIKQDRKWKPFGENSDIDIAIVSKDLFELFWEDLYKYSESGAYWPRKNMFKDYFLQGWIRPDKLPPSKMFQRGGDWWEFFTEATGTGYYGSYKIKAGLYYNWNFLESYQCKCILDCQRDL